MGGCVDKSRGKGPPRNRKYRQWRQWLGETFQQVQLTKTPEHIIQVRNHRSDFGFAPLREGPPLKNHKDLIIQEPIKPNGTGILKASAPGYVVYQGVAKFQDVSARKWLIQNIGFTLVIAYDNDFVSFANLIGVSLDDINNLEDKRDLKNAVKKTRKMYDRPQFQHAYVAANSFYGARDNVNL